MRVPRLNSSYHKAYSGTNLFYTTNSSNLRPATLSTCCTNGAFSTTITSGCSWSFNPVAALTYCSANARQVQTCDEPPVLEPPPQTKYSPNDTVNQRSSKKVRQKDPRVSNKYTVKDCGEGSKTIEEVLSYIDGTNDKPMKSARSKKSKRKAALASKNTATANGHSSKMPDPNDGDATIALESATEKSRPQPVVNGGGNLGDHIDSDNRDAGKALLNGDTHIGVDAVLSPPTGGGIISTSKPPSSAMLPPTYDVSQGKENGDTVHAVSSKKPINSEDMLVVDATGVSTPLTEPRPNPSSTAATAKTNASPPAATKTLQLPQSSSPRKSPINTSANSSPPPPATSFVSGNLYLTDDKGLSAVIDDTAEFTEVVNLRKGKKQRANPSAAPSWQSANGGFNSPGDGFGSGGSSGGYRGNRGGGSSYRGNNYISNYRGRGGGGGLAGGTNRRPQQQFDANVYPQQSSYNYANYNNNNSNAVAYHNATSSQQQPYSGGTTNLFARRSATNSVSEGATPVKIDVTSANNHGAAASAQYGGTSSVCSPGWPNDAERHPSIDRDTAAAAAAVSPPDSLIGNVSESTTASATSAIGMTTTASAVPPCASDDDFPPLSATPKSPLSEASIADSSAAGCCSGRPPMIDWAEASTKDTDFAAEPLNATIMRNVAPTSPINAVPTPTVDTASTSSASVGVVVLSQPPPAPAPPAPAPPAPPAPAPPAPAPPPATPIDGEEYWKKMDKMRAEALPEEAAIYNHIYSCQLDNFAEVRDLLLQESPNSGQSC